MTQTSAFFIVTILTLAHAHWGPPPAVGLVKSSTKSEKWEMLPWSEGRGEEERYETYEQYV